MAPAADPPPTMSAYATPAHEYQHQHQHQRQSSRVSSRNARTRNLSTSGTIVPPSLIPRSLVSASPASGSGGGVASRPGTSGSSTGGSHGHAVSGSYYLATGISPRDGLGGVTDRLRGQPSPSPAGQINTPPDLRRSSAVHSTQGSASSIRRLPSFSLHPVPDKERSPSHGHSGRQALHPASPLPSSASRSGIPRLGDTLLRKLSPSGNRTASDNLPSSSSKSTYLDNQTTTTGLTAPRLRPSPSEGSLFSAMSSPSPSPSNMGPPSLRPPPLGKSFEAGERSTTTTTKQGPHKSPKLGAITGMRGGGGGGGGPSGAAGASREKVRTLAEGSAATTSRSPPPLLPGLDPSLHSPLFDGDDNPTTRNNQPLAFPSMSHRQPLKDSQQDLSLLVPSDATYTEGKRRPDILGRLSSRKPDLHLAIDPPSVQQPLSQPPMSRFSTFSSAHNTPADESGASSRNVSWRGKNTTANHSPALSGRGSSSATPANELTGLGLGGLTPGSSHGDSSISSSPVTHRSRATPAFTTAANLSAIPQTPDRTQDPSPRPSPRNYDRAGQIGIGELSTPRWNFPSSSSSQWSYRTGEHRNLSQSTSASHRAPDSCRAPPDSPNTASRSTAIPPLSVDRTPTDSTSAPLARQRGAEAKRHSRAISLSANSRPNVPSRSPAPPISAIVPSPSVPLHQLDGQMTISSLKRDFGQDPKAYIRSLQEMAGGEPNSPPYSITAMSESDSGLDEPVGTSSAAWTSKHNPVGVSGSDRLQPVNRTVPGHAGKAPSPRLADLAWSGEETGPFVVAGAESSRPQRVARAEQETSQNAGSPTSMDPYGLSEAEYRGSFNLGSAIDDLLRFDEERRQRLKELGLDSETEPSPRASLDSKTARSSLHRKISARKANLSISSPLRTKQDLVTDDFDIIRTRNISSPGHVLGTPPAALSVHKLPPVPSSTSGHSNSQHRASRTSKRMSSASIGHSLLRGSLPFGVPEDLDSEAAEQLRRLDGMSTRKRSISRERPSQETASGRSPRASKSASRPNSVGKGASNAQSRPSSPSSAGGSGAKGARLESTYGTRGVASSGERQRSMDEMRSRRTSKIMSKPRYEENVATSSSPKASLDSPQLSALTSPRVRKTALPPLPIATPMMTNQAGTATTGSSPGTVATSKRTSTVSVASRESFSKEPITPSTTASRLSTSSKNKRASDASSHHSASDMASKAELTEDDDHIGNSSGGPRLGVVIPPVPPLPKAWESNRSQQGVETPGGLPSPSAGPPYDDHASPALMPTSPLSIGNSMQAAGDPKSDLYAHAQTTRAPLGSPLVGDIRANVGVDLPPAGYSYLTHEHQQQQSDIPSASIEPEAHVSRNARASSNSKASSPYANDKSFDSPKVQSSKISAPIPSSPAAARRTPSFFRRRSDANALLAKDYDEISTPPSVVASSENAKLQAPNSGRSSRKSIQGLGNLLRGGNARKSMQLSKADESLPDSEIAMTSFDGSEKGANSGQTPTKTSKILRRSSLIGRKRGKVSDGLAWTQQPDQNADGVVGVTFTGLQTLPSTSDPPVIAPAQLPPLQVAPLPASPLPASAVAEQRESTSQQSTGRPRLANSISGSNLAGRSERNAEPSASAGDHIDRAGIRVPSTVMDRSPEANRNQVQSRTQTQKDDQQTTPSAPTLGSKIPRPTNSIRRTVGRFAGNTSGTGSGAVRPGGNPAPVAAVPTSTAAKDLKRDRPGGAPAIAAAGMTKSYTMSSLASNFGMQPSDEDAASAAGSEITLNGKTSSRRLSLTGRGSSPASGSGVPPLSTAVQLILNAYNAAKTQSDIEGVLRRARITAYSNNLSSTDREVLGNLISRHETPRHTGDRDRPSQPPVVSKAKVSDLISTPRSHKVAGGSSSGITSGGTPAAPSKETMGSAARRPRASMIATSSGARSSREDALVRDPRSTRLSGVSSASLHAENRSVSATPDGVDEDERLGDKEMEEYIQRAHAKKIVNGASARELEEMLHFPEPVPPSRAYSARQAEAMYSHLLSDYELQELFDFKEIFFVGNAQKKIRAYRDRSTDNFGYDDERGDYQVVEGDHLAYRYEIVGTLGRGSFGQVLQCKDHKTGRTVAVKLIRNKKRFHAQALVEVKILQNLVDWDPHEKHNVIKMTDHFYFRSHLCITMELLSINLYELIKANSFAGFSTGLIRRFTTQVIAALSLMKQHRVVHCDLKPENILLMHPRKSGIKVIDFGSSCFEYEKVYTYIQSRFYRSPEVILGISYHTAIDIWSLGCILAELYTGFPLFPGENEQEQLACIMEVLGVPDRYLIERASRKKLFFDSTGAPRPVVNTKGKRRRPGTKTLAQALKCNEEPFVDFLSKCLIWDPDRRIKPDGAMRHPWIRSAAGQKLIAGPNLSLTPGTHVRKSSLSYRPHHGAEGVQAPATTGSLRTRGLTSAFSSTAGEYTVSAIPSSLPRSTTTGNVAGVGSGNGLVSTRRTPLQSSHITSGIAPPSSLASTASSSTGTTSTTTTTTTTTMRRNQQPVS